MVSRRSFLVLAALVMAAAPRRALADSSFTAAARSLVRELGSLPHPAIVVASPLTTDAAAPRGDELSSRLAAVVAGAIGSDARAEARPLSLPVARARTRTALVYLDVRVESGELRVTADVYPPSANVWDRLRTAEPPATAHAYLHVPVTAEARAYLAPLHLERASVTKFTHDLGTVLAVACGDLDGAGGDGLALVSEREVAWGYLRQGRFVAVSRVAASALAARAPAPLREPIGKAQIVANDGADLPASLYLGWGDRLGVSVGADLIRRSRLAGMPGGAARDATCLLPSAARGGFDDAAIDCLDGRPKARAAAAGPPLVVDAWAAYDLVGVAGEESRVVAVREPSGALHLSRPGSTGTLSSLDVNDVGAQLALGDLDQDGVADVVTTTAHGEDALILSSWQNGRLVARLRFPAPAGVDAVAVCPPEANNAPTTVAAVGGEIWLVR
jgi:hypothetical protein